MKRIAFAALCLAAAAATAAEVYVDRTNGVDSVEAGAGSAEAPYRTLQFAVDKSATGGTIYVRPGVYDENKSCAPNSPSDVKWGYARMAISGKVLKIVSTDGPERTFIKGEFDPESEYGLGTNSVRCVQGYNCAGTVIEGFTLCDGSTKTNGYCGANGGAYQTDSENGRAYFVNCTITNCIAYYGAACYATFVRCTFRDNHFGGPHNSPTLMYNNCNAMDCVFYANSAYKNGDMIIGGTLINCTILGNYFATQTTTGTKIYNCIAFNGKAGRCLVNSTTQVCSETNWTVFPVMSSLTADIRVRKGAAAETMGDAQYRSSDYLALPEGVDRNKDIAGNPVPETGTIMAGALQETATPAAGAIQFNSVMYATNGTQYSAGRMELLVDGKPSRMLSASTVSAYLVPATYPVQYSVRLHLPKGLRPICSYFTFGFGSSTMLYPEPDDSFLITPPPVVGTVQTNGSWRLGPVIYADASADPALADGTEEHPYATLQAAATRYPYTVVVAKPGVYANDVNTVTPNGYSRPISARLALTGGSNSRRIIGEEGAERTFIVGASDPDTLGESVMPGCGTNTVRCVTVTDGYNQIQGFTLTGGYTHLSDRGGASCDVKGGAFFSGAWNTQFSDCIITNNHADQYVTHFAQLRRCLVRDNVTCGGIISYSVLVSCIVGPNESGNKSYISADAAYVYQSTIVGDGTGRLCDNSDYFRQFNSVFMNGGKAYSSGSKGGNIYHNTVGDATTSALDTFIDPALMNPAALDVRPFTANSPAMTAGLGVDAPTAQEIGAWWYVHTDYTGAPLDLGAAKHVSGAIQTPADGTGVYVLGTASIAGANAGFNTVPAGGTLTISAAAGGRPAAGLLVDGVTNLFEELPGHVYTVTEADAAAGTVIGVIYTSDWYAAPNGNDAATGYYPADAKSLKGALAAAVSGDRVLALPGVYSTGVATQDTTHVIGARAVVPSYVTLESTDGAAVTTILGKTADVEDDEYYEGKSSNGMGWGAVRGVYLNANAKLKGFTISGGRTRGHNKDAPHAGNVHSDADYNGGGVFAASRATCRVEDCFFTNNAAFRGGGLKSSTCFNCTFTGGYSLYGGGATSDSRLINCLSYGNACAYPNLVGQHDGFFYSESLDGCTALDSFGGLCGSTGEAKYFVRNTLVKGVFYIGATGTPASNVTYSAWDTSKMSGLPTGVTKATWLSNTGVGCIATNAAALAVGEDCRPVIGENAGIDAGDPATEEISELDFGGGQRVYNGRRDIGAFEADWRGVYAKDIRSSGRIAVTAAGKNVVESEEKTVRLPSGQTLVAEVGASAKPVRYMLRVRVSGEGTLTVTRGGETVGTFTSADGTASLPVVWPASGGEIEFAYSEADGYAEILGADPLAGMMLRFR